MAAGAVTEQEARQAFGAALEAQPVRPASFILYFLEGRDELSVVHELFHNPETYPRPWHCSSNGVIM